MKKKYLDIIIYTFLLLLAGAVVFIACRQSNQATAAIAILIEQTIKKIKKGFSVEETADMLEESIDTIQRIYDIAASMEPDYDIEKIYEELQKSPASIC